MNFRLWIIPAFICFMMCFSCSNEEPKVDTSDNEPTIEVDGDNSDDETPQITMDILTGKPWLGRYFIEYKDGDANYQRVVITFKGLDEISGSGKMTVTNDDTSSEHQFDFKIIGDTVMCNVLSSEDKARECETNVYFKFRDNLLYLESPGFEPIILGKNDEVFSDATGPLGINFKTLPDKICNLWLHENRMNILFWFSIGGGCVYQLTEPGSKKYNYYDSSNNNLFQMDEISENMTITFYGWAHTLSWKPKVVTDNVLVLQDDINDDVKIVDVFYAASKDVLPKHVAMNYHDLFYITAPWGIGGMQE